MRLVKDPTPVLSSNGDRGWDGVRQRGSDTMTTPGALGPFSRFQSRSGKESPGFHYTV